MLIIHVIPHSRRQLHSDVTMQGNQADVDTDSATSRQKVTGLIKFVSSIRALPNEARDPIIHTGPTYGYRRIASKFTFFSFWLLHGFMYQVTHSHRTFNHFHNRCNAPKPTFFSVWIIAIFERLVSCSAWKVWWLWNWGYLFPYICAMEDEDEHKPTMHISSNSNKEFILPQIQYLSICKNLKKNNLGLKWVCCLLLEIKLRRDWISMLIRFFMLSCTLLHAVIFKVHKDQFQPEHLFLSHRKTFVCWKLTFKNPYLQTDARYILIWTSK